MSLIFCSKKYIIIILILFAFLLRTNRASSDDSDGFSASTMSSLNWQRLMIEERIQKSLSHSLSPVVPLNKLIINVGVKLKPEELPQGDESESDKNLNHKKSNPELIEEQSLTISDELLMSKLDLEREKIDENEKKDEKTEVSLENKLSKNIDIFNLIDKIKIHLVIDRSIPEARKEVIAKIAETSLAHFSEIKPDLKIEMVELVQEETSSSSLSEANQREFSIEKWNPIRWIFEFRNAIGFVVASLVFSLIVGIIILLVSRGFRKIEEKKVSILEAKQGENSGSHGSEVIQNRALPEPGEFSQGSSNQIPTTISEHDSLLPFDSGFDKLKILLNKTPKDVVHLIRRWIRNPEVGSVNALTILPRVLVSDDLQKVFNGLELSDRKEWNTIISSNSDFADYQVAEKFIANQIIEFLLISESIIDPELKSLVEDLKIEEIVEIATKNPTEGAFLASVITQSQLANLFSMISSETADALMKASIKLKSEQLQSAGSRVKNSIESTRKNRKMTSIPLLERTTELLRHVTADKEMPIFEALAAAGELELLQVAARSLFPSVLFKKLSDEVIKACLDLLPLNRKVDLIFSREDEERGVFLNSLGKPGSKIRDMMELELQQLGLDELRKRRVQKNRNTIWGEFLSLAREYLNRNEIAQQQASEILNVWIQEFYKKNFGGNVNEKSVAS